MLCFPGPGFSAYAPTPKANRCRRDLEKFSWRKRADGDSLFGRMFAAIRDEALGCNLITLVDLNDGKSPQTCGRNAAVGGSGFCQKGRLS